MIGPHIINSVSPHLDLLRRWQPRLITVLDPRDNEIAALREACPHTTIVGRIYVPDSEVEARIRANPESAAHWAHSLVTSRIAPDVDYWQIANEVLQQYDDLSLLNQFELARMRLADSAGLYKCAIFAFSVGNPHLPEDDRMAYWRQVYPAIEYAETNDHVVAVHQYGSPTLWEPDDDWYIHRLEHQVLPDLPYKRVKFACTEFGVDHLINGHSPSPSGWQDSTDAEAYAHDLTLCGQYLEMYNYRVIGYSVFTLGHNPPWSSYDISGPVAEYLTAYYEKDPQIPPPRPQPERRLSDAFAHMNMHIEEDSDAPEFVIKDVFTTRDGNWDSHTDIYDVPEWARADYLKPYGASDWFDDAGADHNLFARVEDENGDALDIEIMFWSGPSEDEIVRRHTGAKGSGWQNIPIFNSFSPERGEMGAWRWGPSAESEIIAGGGLPNNLHVSTFVVWRKSADVPDPPPKPEPEPERRIVVPVVDGVVTQHWMQNVEPYLSRFGIPGHNGLDIAQAHGVPVLSIADGVVMWEDWDNNYGHYVRVWHEQFGFHSFYAHLGSRLVSQGQFVDAGQPLGYLGDTGFSSGPHLHLEIRLGAEYEYETVGNGHARGRIDPYPILRLL